MMLSVFTALAIGLILANCTKCTAKRLFFGVDAQESGTRTVDQYALSEVVIQHGIDILELTRPQKRQTAPKQLKNNVPQYSDINPEDIHYWQFPASELQSPQYTNAPTVPSWEESDTSTSERLAVQELKRRQQTIYITVNICSQPEAMTTSPQASPDGLSFYVSQSDDNKNPGPNYRGTQQSAPVTTDGGHAFYEEFQSGDTYIGVAAPKLNGFSGKWNYQIAVSNQNYYTSYYDFDSLNFVDSDPTSAFFVTNPLANTSDQNSSLAQQWNATGGPFGVFIYDAGDASLSGINKSFCGLQTYVKAASNLQGMTTNGSEVGMKFYNSSVPYQQVYIPQLNKSSQYLAALALPANYSLSLNSPTPGGGGTVWRSIGFSTHETDNCKLIYNLTFCDGVTYSVPTNGSMNVSTLKNWYDNDISGNLWPLFQNSLDQIPCNTSADAKYSLARSCDDCSSAYKEWLCAVSIPRCAEYSSPAPFLRVRNANQGNTSWPNQTVPENDSAIADPYNAVARNAQLNSFVSGTGPYKEVLPCDFLCYDLVQSCPGILGFACPKLGKGLEWGYGVLDLGQNITYEAGYPLCNAPKYVWGLNAANSPSSSPFLIVFTLTIVILWTLD